MTVPFRRWLAMDRALLEGYYLGAGNTAADWTTFYRPLCRLGGRNPTSDPKNYYWHSIFRPRAGLGFERLVGMDEIVDVKWDINLYRQHLRIGSDITRFDLVQGFVNNDNPWHHLYVSGRYYDGANEWDAYPPKQHPGYNNPQITVGALWTSESVTCYMYSWKAGGGNGVESNRYQSHFFRGGSHFLLADYQPAFPADGKRFRLMMHPFYMDVRYFNPVVNECQVNGVEQYWVPINTGVELKLIGMGFNNDDDELDGLGFTVGYDSRGASWDDLVDVIEFWRQQDALFGIWKDDFDDELIDSIWTQIHTDADKTFAESGGELTVGIDGVGAYLWYNGIHSPMCYRSLPAEAVGKDFTLTIKLNSYTIDTASFAGLFIGTNEYIDDKLWVKVENLATAPTAGETISDANGAQGTVMADTWYEIGGGEGYFCLENKTTNLWHGFSWCNGSIGGVNMFVGRNDGLLEHTHIWAFGMVRGGIGRRAVKVRRNNSYYNDDPPDSNDWGPTLPVWLQIRNAGGVLTFWYSTDGVSFDQYEDSGSPFSASLLDMIGYDEGLVVGLIGAGFGTPTFDAPFDFFELNWGGTPYAILKEADGDFTVDTNLQITIPTGKFPMLEAGSYILRLIKEEMDFSPRNADVDVWGWAGDWRCTPGGMISDGIRIVIEARVGPPLMEPREKRGSIILMDLDKRDKAGNITKEYHSEEDIKAPDKLYVGDILETSPFRRGLDDKTGMFKVADMTLVMDNSTKKYSKLLATHDIKNQLARFYHVFIDDPENWKSQIVTMVVEDYNIKGSRFEMILKDVSQKYFGVELPANVCLEGPEDEDKFPNIHEGHMGRAMPEILGLAELKVGEYKGAVEAVYVDTVNYKYLAAGRQLHSINEVYADNELVDSGNWEIVYNDRRTFIAFTGDQGDAKITFNCNGYPYGGWNSGNGFVQNPAWILAYFLTEMLNVPLSLLASDTFTDLATAYIIMGEAEAGKLILQDQKKSDEILRELLFSFGSKCYVSKRGEFAVGRKNLSNYSSDLVVFEQFDILQAINRTMGMKDMVNVATVHFDYFPTHDLYAQAATEERRDLIDRYGRREDRRLERRARRREAGRR